MSCTMHLVIPNFSDTPLIDTSPLYIGAGVACYTIGRAAEKVTYACQAIYYKWKSEKTHSTEEQLDLLRRSGQAQEKFNKISSTHLFIGTLGSAFLVMNGLLGFKNYQVKNIRCECA